LSQGKLGVFRVALTDFDHTLTRLFDGAALQTAYLNLAVFYERQGVPVDSLPNEADPYAVWHGAYDWMQRSFLLHINRVTRLVRRVFGRGHRFQHGRNEAKTGADPRGPAPCPGSRQTCVLRGRQPYRHARRAGVLTIGVCTGKASKQELLEAGADDCITSFAELQSFRFG